MKIRARAPLRLGLAGGGTDVSPFCDQHGGFVLNATIDLYACVTLTRHDTGPVQLAAADLRRHATLPLSPRLSTDDPALALHAGVYNRIVAEFQRGEPLGVSLTTHCDAPAGSGLGSSSTLVVAMVKAFVELLGLPLGEYDIARLAYDIERNDLGLAGGRQDQYAAAFGGVNFMEFYADERVIVNPLRIKNWILSELESSIVLYYSGVSRESARIIEEEKRLMTRGDARQLAGLHTLKSEARAMKEYILRGDMRHLAASMQAGWEAKKTLADRISTPDIDHAIDTAMAAGAYAAKISGAGGGGYVILFTDPARHPDVRHALDALGVGRTQTCHFTRDGTQGWRID